MRGRILRLSMAVLEAAMAAALAVTHKQPRRQPIPGRSADEVGGAGGGVRSARAAITTDTEASQGDSTGIAVFRLPDPLARATLWSWTLTVPARPTDATRPSPSMLRPFAVLWQMRAHVARVHSSDRDIALPKRPFGLLRHA